MKKINILLLITIFFFIACFVGVNLAIKANENQSDYERPYKVEINRIEQEIKENEFNDIDITNYHYITNVTQYSTMEEAIDTDSDYVIKKIKDSYIRFEYCYYEVNNTSLYILINTILALLFVFAILFLFYIKYKILKPFNRLSLVPYELSKGILTKPLEDEKNGRYFGKFIWGVDLLRENMEKQKMRELELQKEKKTLLLSLSHDIKTPLSAIKLYSKAISTGLYEDDLEKKNKIADSINLKADEIEHYISEIIKTSNDDLFQYDVENNNFYLSKLIGTIKDYYSEKLDLIHIEFIVEEYNDCMIYADYDRSVEVIQNIVENAIKYGNGEQIKISFSIEENCQLITIMNKGDEISSNELPHLFESFYRGTNVKNLPGSGLGLYICKKLMHKMNGEIFASPVDDGMSFTLVFQKA